MLHGQVDIIVFCSFFSDFYAILRLCPAGAGLPRCFAADTKQGSGYTVKPPLILDQWWMEDIMQVTVDIKETTTLSSKL